MNRGSPFVRLAAGLVGMILGGALGCLAREWMCAHWALDAAVLPGAMVGLGCAAATAWLRGGRSWPLGGLSAVAGLVAGILSEWRCFPFAADDRLTFFLGNLGHVRPPAQIMIVLGTVLAFWFALGRPDSNPVGRQPPPT